MATGIEVIDRDTGEVTQQLMTAEQASLAIQLSRAEIDQKIATAKAFPRSITEAVRKIMTLATLDEDTAEECSYALPRGGKPIVGPSARFAEIVYQNWGNCIVGARVVHVDRAEKYVEAEGVYHDLETNASRTARVRRRIVDKYGRLYSDDMIIVTGNAACSIASRNAVLAGVPRGVWRKAYEAAQAVVKGDVKTLAERRETIFKAFAAFGVTPEQLFVVLGIGGADDITLEHIPTLTGMRAALKSGEETVETMFGSAVGKGSGEKKSTRDKMQDLAEGKEKTTGEKGKRGGRAEKDAEEEIHDDSGRATKSKRADPDEREADEGTGRDQEGDDAGEQEGGDLGTPSADDIEAARDRGHDAYHKGMRREMAPKEFSAKGREAEKAAWLEAYDAARAEDQDNG